MNDFLKKHVLMPSHSKYAYIYLVFLIPIIVSIFPFDNVKDWITLGLLIIFYVLYRRGYIDDFQTDQQFVLQMAISVIITLYTGYANIFIFFAYSYNFWSITDRERWKYSKWYYLVSVSSISLALWIGQGQISNEEWIWIGVGILFILLSPILAWFLAKENQYQYQLAINNSRLEMVIRQNERDRIARDLHDTLGQSYSTMTIKAELAMRLIDINQQQAKYELDEIASMSRDNLNLVRKIVSDLQELTIAAAMIESSEILKNKNIILITEGEEVTENWPLKVQYVIAAVIREATTNILRHSQAKRAKYTFIQMPKQLKVIIYDDGTGFRDEAPADSYGLKGMNQRVEEIGGEFILSQDKGTKISITIPREDK